MLEIIRAGGWLMVPIIGCSVVALAIVLERLWTLQRSRVLPDDLTRQVWEWVSRNELNHSHIQSLQAGSPLGRVLAAGLVNRNRDRQIMKEGIEDTGRHVVHDLERYLNLLATIAYVSPLLGLLGTTTGMVNIFAALSAGGTSAIRRCSPAAFPGPWSRPSAVFPWRSPRSSRTGTCATASTDSSSTWKRKPSRSWRRSIGAGIWTASGTAMRLQKRRNDEHLELNVVSLVDVVLLLLIFFVLTTSFVRQSQLAIHLPEASATPPPDIGPPPAVEITVTANGGFFVNGRALVDSRPETLAAAIRRVMPDSQVHEVTISADARAAYQDVVTVMDVVGRLGVSDVHIATIRPRSD